MTLLLRQFQRVYKNILILECISYQARYLFKGLFPMTLTYEKRYTIVRLIPIMTWSSNLATSSMIHTVRESYVDPPHQESTSRACWLLAFWALAIINFRPRQEEEERG